MKNYKNLKIATNSNDANVPKKVTCSCLKSRCSKMYCDCLKFGQFCGPDCYCRNCENRADSASRFKTIRDYKKRISKLKTPINDQTK